VLRDVRATLQAAIEHGGLTPASHRKFLNVYHPAINRAAFGPPLRRNEELLALLDAGVIAIHAGPGSRIEIDENDSTYVLNTKFAGGVQNSRWMWSSLQDWTRFFPKPTHPYSSVIC
jgi:hypothetical protein